MNSTEIADEAADRNLALFGQRSRPGGVITDWAATKYRPLTGQELAAIGPDVSRETSTDDPPEELPAPDPEPVLEESTPTGPELPTQPEEFPPWEG